MYIDGERKMYLFYTGKVVAIFSEGHNMDRDKDFAVYIKEKAKEYGVEHIILDIQEVGVSLILHLAVTVPHFLPTNTKDVYDNEEKINCLEIRNLQDIEEEKRLEYIVLNN